IFIEVGVNFLPNILRLIGTCVVLLCLKWWLALLVLVPAPAVVALTMAFYRRLSRMYHRLWQRRSRMSALAADSISGIRVVKASSQEQTEIRRFGERSTELYQATAHAESMWSTAAPIIYYTTTFGTFLVWYFGGLGVLREDVSLGTLMAFIGYMFMFYGPIQMVTQWSNFANRAFTAAQRLFEITDAEQEAYDAPDAQALGEVQGAFTFEDVHFSYVKDKPVLKEFDLEVRPGEMIGLVGRSGVGKTTVTNLICRFYDVDDGAIKLDGVDLRKVKLRDLRRHIGIVPQESFLFNGSIAENIAYARPGATQEEVIGAARAANAHGFIARTPDGYDTRVGERGARLSGGEKQRIAIARAILQDPKILVLDEATSSVDTETEELIQDALALLVKGRTTFAIAHRLSTLKNADRLVVIDDGKVAEVGTHDELLAKKGMYQKLVEMQSKLSAIKAVDG
ncbi:MAG: ABC transporter ATP-binding protein, partial [Planctomycetota bacterium]